MDSFAHPPVGAANLPLFQDRSLTVLLEGVDDVPFWKWFFPKEHAGRTIQFRHLGGKQELLKAIELARTRAQKPLVAMDSDYDRLLGTFCTDTFVVVTRRYAIENYIFDVTVLHALVEHCCGAGDGCKANVDQWVTAFEEAIRPLLVCDLTARRLRLSLEVMGRTCHPYMNKVRPTPSKTLIAKRVRHVARPLPADEIATSNGLLAHYCSCGSRAYHWIRGHLILHAVKQFIRHQNGRSKRKFSVSDDQFIDLASMAFGAVRDSIADFVTTQEDVAQALKSVVG